ncbi:hypothetical protein CL622_05415 [archaeon]|nr:hypothetical protein [archaeon]
MSSEKSTILAITETIAKGENINAALKLNEKITASSEENETTKVVSQSEKKEKQNSTYVKYLDEKKEGLNTIRCSLEDDLSTLFADLSVSQQVRVEFIAEVKENGRVGVLAKLKHPAIKCPIIFDTSGNETNLSTFRHFGRRVYRRKQKN